MNVKKFIYSQLAPVVAFLPFVQLAYPVIQFLSSATGKERIGSIAIFTTLVVSAAGYKLLPDMWGWVVTYGVGVCFSLLCLQQIRKSGDFFRDKNRKIMRKRSIILVGFVAIWLAAGVTLFGNTQLKDQTTAMLHAIVAEDQMQWAQLCYPGNTEIAASVQEFATDLQENGVQLQGTVESLRCTKLSSHKTSSIRETSATFRATIGSKQYTVHVVYQEKDGNEGFTAFSIVQ